MTTFLQVLGRPARRHKNKQMLAFEPSTNRATLVPFEGGTWLHGKAYWVSRAWCTMWKESDDFILQYKQTRVSISDESIEAEVLDGSWFSNFVLRKGGKCVLKVKYWNAIALKNPLLDPRTRDDVDDWYDLARLLSIEDYASRTATWRHYPFRYDPKTLKFDFFDGFRTESPPIS
jgi:hypothetical protein